jgi:hypothetical protein
VQHDRLEQRNHRDHLVSSNRLQGQTGRAVRPDQQSQLGQELCQVEPELEVACRHVTAPGIEQDDVTIVGEQDAVGGQCPVCDAVSVQPENGFPYPQQLIVGRPGIGGPGPVLVGRPGTGGRAPLVVSRLGTGDSGRPGRGRVGARRPGIIGLG